MLEIEAHGCLISIARNRTAFAHTCIVYGPSVSMKVKLKSHNYTTLELFFSVLLLYTNGVRSVKCKRKKDDDDDNTPKTLNHNGIGDKKNYYLFIRYNIQWFILAFRFALGIYWNENWRNEEKKTTETTEELIQKRNMNGTVTMCIKMSLFICTSLRSLLSVTVWIFSRFWT